MHGFLVDNIYTVVGDQVFQPSIVIVIPLYFVWFDSFIGFVNRSNIPFTPCRWIIS
jgi:hypothetical protein